MNEFEIDKSYLDESFIKKINACDDEKFTGLVNYMLEHYNDDISQTVISNFNKIIFSFFGTNIDANQLYRQVKYLINKGVYNRISKKFKNDLLTLLMTEEKIDIIIEFVRQHLESINSINKNNDLNEHNLIVKDFEIKTEMPIYSSNYELKNASGGINEDLKKQNVLFKFNLKSNKNENKENNNLIFQMDKTQLINFYEEVEKIQEKLDKLY